MPRSLLRTTIQTEPAVASRLSARRLVGRLLFAASVGLASLGFAAERPPLEQQQPTYRVQSNLVQVDVTVRTNKGDLVTDLEQQDFVVTEGGVVQEIVTFSLEEIPTASEVLPTLAGDGSGEVLENSPEAADIERPAEEPPVIYLDDTTPTSALKNKRLLILLFDLSSLQDEDLLRSISSAEAFVTEKITPHDLIALATYESDLELLLDLTNDHKLVLETIRTISPFDAGGGTTEDFGDEETSDDVYVPDDVQFDIFNTDRRLSALGNLAKAYGEFPERKSLIYFSSGFRTTGIENQSQIRATVDLANQTNLSIYTADSRGLAALPPGGDVSRRSPRGNALFSGRGFTRQMDSLNSSQETLTTLAYDTGGTSFQDTNDLGSIFDKVLDDTRAYYVLGYYSSNTKKDGKFRKIKVEVKRPGLKLTHRPGYYASKEFSKMSRSERDQQLEEAFGVDRPFTELPFILQADYFRKDDDRNFVPISVQLAGDALAFDEKRKDQEARIEFLAQVTDTDGKVAGVTRDVVALKLSTVKAERIRAGKIMYNTGFDLKPGSYSLKFLMRDNRTGKLGTFQREVEVPVIEGKQLQTSSIVLGNRLVKSDENTEGVRHERFGGRRRRGWRQEATDPFKIGEQRLVPSIGNVFASRQTVYVYFQVYGVSEAKDTRNPKLETYLMLLKSRTKVFEAEPYSVTEWAEGSKGVVAVTMAVPLNGLRAGDYALQIHVRDRAADANLFQRVPVIIR